MVQDLVKVVTRFLGEEAVQMNVSNAGKPPQTVGDTYRFDHRFHLAVDDPRFPFFWRIATLWRPATCSPTKRSLVLTEQKRTFAERPSHWELNEMLAHRWGIRIDSTISPCR